MLASAPCRAPTLMSAANWNRKLHRWGAISIALPLAVVIGSGLLLQLKKEVAWVQPPTSSGAAEIPSISFDAILAAARSVPATKIESWADVDRLDVRPAKGIVKVRPLNSHWEIQVDTATGAVLQTAFRRSDVIEMIHDGSFFHERAKLWLFLPTGLVLLGLWVSGIYLWLLPHLVKRRRKLARARIN